MLVIAVCAVICGAEGWEDIEEDGKAQAEWFEQVLDLPHGIPCDDTFRRVFSRLDADALTRCFIAWSEALHDISHGDCVSPLMVKPSGIPLTVAPPRQRCTW